MFLTAEDEWLAVRRASVAARGVLADLLYLIERLRDRGAVRHGDVVLRMIGVSEPEFEACISELVACGVIRLSNGLIVSDRMERNQRIRESLAENGRKGGRPRKQSETSLVNPETEPKRNQDTE